MLVKLDNVTRQKLLTKLKTLIQSNKNEMKQTGEVDETPKMIKFQLAKV